MAISFDENKNFYIYYLPISEIPHSDFYTNNLIKEIQKSGKLLQGKNKLNLWKKAYSEELIKKLKK